VELAEMIRRRAVSCREVVTTALARFDAARAPMATPIDPR
jgi:Asp-tRNA(Asn)/Glu-tRNA(Gln) amidotransferase A subunit family amidase